MKCSVKPLTKGYFVPFKDVLTSKNNFYDNICPMFYGWLHKCHDSRACF